MTIERRLQIMLIITVIFGVASVFTIVHISKNTRFHQLNAHYIEHVNQFSDLLNQSSTHLPALSVVLDSLYLIRDEADACMEMTNVLDRAVMHIIGTGGAIGLCRINSILTQTVINKLESRIRETPNAYVLDNETRNNILYAPEVLRANSNKFEKLVNETVEFTIKAALWFILPFSMLVILLCYTIIRGVTRNAIEYRETAEALAESEIENRQLAYYDSLTELPNRNLLSDRLEQTILSAQRNKNTFALMFVDLDRFKHINDTLGHVAGDQLIKEAAGRIRKCLRASDTLSRFGGDEFVIILPELRSPADVSIVARKIIDQVAKPFCLDNVDTHVTASLGIAVYPDNGRDISTLMKRADIAMYQAKDNGKNQFCYYNNELNKKADKRLLLERDLRKAIDQDEFSLHYQPVVDLGTGRIVGVEALLRWHHGDEGMVPPAEFIPIAEDTGLIVDIGYMVLDMACRQCMVWRQTHGIDLHVAVNVSARQLREENLVDFVEGCLNRYSLPPDALDIEITESAFYSNDSRSIKTLHTLDDLETRLLLDDFGTGYSSLSTLSSMPFDIIKIDRSFIQTQDGKNRKIAESILDMADNFGMQVVAEGIEERSIAGFLRQRGCRYGQGYLFMKPAPAEEINLAMCFEDLITTPPTMALVSVNR